MEIFEPWISRSLKGKHIWWQNVIEHHSIFFTWGQIILNSFTIQCNNYWCSCESRKLPGNVQRFGTFYKSYSNNRTSSGNSKTRKKVRFLSWHFFFLNSFCQYIDTECSSAMHCFVLLRISSFLVNAFDYNCINRWIISMIIYLSPASSCSIINICNSVLLLYSYIIQQSYSWIRYGCHHCGSKQMFHVQKGFIADHMPPTKNANEANSKWWRKFFNFKVSKYDCMYYVLYSIALYYIILDWIGLYYIVLYYIILDWIGLDWIVLYCIVLYCFVLYCFVLYCIVLCCIVLCCVVLYCIDLYCTVLYCIILYCIILYCILYDILFYFFNQSSKGYE